MNHFTGELSATSHGDEQVQISRLRPGGDYAPEGENVKVNAEGAIPFSSEAPISDLRSLWRTQQFMEKLRNLRTIHYITF